MKLSPILAKKFPHLKTDLGVKSFSAEYSPSQFIKLQSRGDLYIPSQKGMELFQKFEKLFKNFHGETINTGIRPIERFSKLLRKRFPNIPAAALQIYAKTRFFYTPEIVE